MVRAGTRRSAVPNPTTRNKLRKPSFGHGRRICRPATFIKVLQVMVEYYEAIRENKSPVHRTLDKLGYNSGGYGTSFCQSIGWPSFKGVPASGIGYLSPVAQLNSTALSPAATLPSATAW